jgi:hydrogenase maturation protease
MTGEILILGVGNILLGDEGAGVHAVNEMMQTPDDFPSSVDIADGGTAGFDLISLMKGRKKIIIIDSLESADDPGSVFRLSRDELQIHGRIFSAHDLGILHAADALEISGEKAEIEFIGIVPESTGKIQIGLSEKVRQSIPEVINLVKSIISEKAVLK